MAKGKKPAKKGSRNFRRSPAALQDLLLYLGDPCADDDDPKPKNLISGDKGKGPPMLFALVAVIGVCANLALRELMAASKERR